jgi:hypothetical protein
VVNCAENMSVASILPVSRDDFSQGLYTVFSDTRHINNNLTGYIHIFNFMNTATYGPYIGKLLGKYLGPLAYYTVSTGK